MRSQTAAVLASLLSIVCAVPVATDECVVETATVTAASSTSSCTVIVTTVLSTDVPSVIATLTSATVTTSAISGSNVQLFTGTLGGAAPPVISGTGTRPFEVNGDTFVGEGAALGRSCDVQHNKCANAANSGQLTGGVAVCDAQNQACHGFNNVKAKAKRNMPLAPVRRAAVTTASTPASATDECSIETVTATATRPDLASTPVGAVAVTITSCV